MFRPDLFAGQTALVTGGGSGIGHAISARLLELGATVYIASRKSDRLESALPGLRALGDCRAIELDIRNRDGVERALDLIKEQSGRLDLLVNNAGGQFPSTAENISPNGWDAVIATNLTGTWNVTRAGFLKFFEPQAGGTVVNIIANIYRGFPGMAHTGAARAGVDNLTKTLAVEWCKHGVRINSVAPGIIQSSGLENYPPELVRGIADKIPMKRLGSVDDVAWLTLFLASPMAGFITGETVYVDGGQRLWGDMWEIG
jgi:citronellol/citronellal dehydrogenase